MKVIEIILVTIYKLLDKVLVFIKGGGSKTEAVRVTIADEDLTTLTCNTSPLLPVSFDASGAARMSMKHLTGFYNHLRGLNSNLEYVATGSSTAVFNSTLKSCTLRVVADNDIAILKSYKAHPCVTGKSSFFEFTFGNFHNETGATKRIGAWHSNKISPFQSNFDGFYLESYSTGEGAGYRIVINNQGVDLKIEQSNWDDPLDGTGASGVTVDFTKLQIIRTDFLGMGGSRLAFIIYSEGRLITFHSYKNANYSDTLLFSKPNLPIRAEIIGDATIIGSPRFDFISSVAAIEDSQDFPGNSNTIRTGVTPSDNLDLPLAGNAYLGIAMRIGSTYDDVVLILKAVGILSASNDAIAWEVIIDPVIAGDPLVWNNADANNTVEFAIGNNTNIVSGGEKVIGDVVRSNRDDNFKSNKIKRIGKSLTDTSQILAVVLTPSGANGNATVVLNYDQF